MAERSIIPLPISDVAEWDDEERLDRFPPGWPMTGGEGSRAYVESEHPRDPGGAHGGEWIKKGTIAAGGKGSQAAVPGEGRGRPDVRFSEATPEEFLVALRGNTRAWNLTEHSAEELADSQVFLSEDGKTGITVSADGDIQNAFRNPGGIKGSGKQAVVHAMMHGGVTLDCYDGYLPGLYGSLGFVETGRMKFNPEYAPEGMPAGETPDVVFMALDAKASNKYYDDWDEAKAAARKAVGKKKVVDVRDVVTLADWTKVPGLATAGRAYDPNEPRLPKGHPEGGQWTRLGGAPGVIAPWKEVIQKKSTFPRSEVTMENLSEKDQKRVREAWKKYTGKSADEVLENLREVFELADADSFDAGMAWYQDVNEWATDQGRIHDLSPETTAGTIAALSPLTEWETNKRLAGLMLQYYSLDPEKFRSMNYMDAAQATIDWARDRGETWPMGAGKRNARMAARILQGETPDAVLPAAKTRSFYNSIIDPTNPIDVCIDTHMLNAAYGGNTPGAKGLIIEVSEPDKAEAWGPIVKPRGAKFIPRKPVDWFATPEVTGQSVGVIPLLTDSVRTITDEWNAVHPDQKLVPLQTQAIIWTQWLKMHPAQEKRAAVKATQQATIKAALAAAAARAQWQL